MEITISSRDLDKVSADLVVFLVHSTEIWSQTDDEAQESVIAEYRRSVGRKAVKSPMIWGAPAGAGAERHYWMFAPECVKHLTHTEQVKVAAARAAAYARSMRLRRLAFVLNTPSGSQRADFVAEGLLLGGYRFDKYQTREKPKVPKIKAEILVDPSTLAEMRGRVKTAQTVCDAVNHARDLINEPGSVVFPDILAKEARRIATKRKLDCTVLDKASLRKQGYNGLLAVGHGSKNDPRLIVLRYKPRKKSKTHLALVGKGITFDTGGICLKPGGDMWQMKGDMSGAAAVLGAMQSIAALKPKIHVTGIVAAAHNAIGPDATHPGDIVLARNGKTIEVNNTDAEGRIVLSDALHRAGEEGATHVVDIATLTGSCMRALGHALSGLFTADNEFRDQILEAGNLSGESFWPLPLLDEYRELIDSHIADVNNIGSSKNAGAITAALFLREFVPDGVRWAHLDIAGSELLTSKWRYFGKGATGFTVRTLTRLSTEILG
jgi:leucyl aminopeptidase